MRGVPPCSGTGKLCLCWDCASSVRTSAENFPYRNFVHLFPLAKRGE
jgi:hypothetical protein